MDLVPSFAYLQGGANTGFLNSLAALSNLRHTAILSTSTNFNAIASAGFNNALSALANTVLGAGVPSTSPVVVTPELTPFVPYAFPPPAAAVPAAGLPVPVYPSEFVAAPTAGIEPYIGFESPALINSLLGAYNLALVARLGELSRTNATFSDQNSIQLLNSANALTGPATFTYAP